VQGRRKRRIAAPGIAALELGEQDCATFDAAQESGHRGWRGAGLDRGGRGHRFDFIAGIIPARSRPTNRLDKPEIRAPRGVARIPAQTGCAQQYSCRHEPAVHAATTPRDRDVSRASH
jgi:hypothetical protein